MGTVNAYMTKTKGRLWEVWYSKPDGSRGHERGFKRERDANAYLATVEVSKLKGAYVDRADSKVTLEVLGAAWLGVHESLIAPSSFHSVESTWRTHVLPKWGGYAVGAITAREVKSWLAGLEVVKGKHPDGTPKRFPASHTTTARARDMLAAILDDAVEDNRIVKNVARGIAIKKKPMAKNTYLSHRQVERLASTALYPDLVRFLAYSGLRWGEATALRVRNVDLARRRATIDEAVAEVNGKPVLGGVKSWQQRTVGWPDFLDAEVAAACAGKRPGERLWNAKDGGYLRPGNNVSGWFAGAVKRAQRADAAFPRVTPHDLRHTAASLAISAGANVKVLQTMLGHRDASETLNTYAALFPDDLDGLTAALSRHRAEQL